jgi:hypothetical protein
MKLKYAAIVAALFSGAWYSKEKLIASSGHSKEETKLHSTLQCISKKNAIWTDEPRVQVDNDTQFIFKVFTDDSLKITKEYTNYSPPKVIWTKEFESVKYENELGFKPEELQVFRAKDSSVMVQMVFDNTNNPIMFTIAGFSSAILFIDSGTCIKKSDLGD